MSLTFDLLSVGSASIMGIYLFCCCILIKRDETVKEIFACKVIVVATSVVGEVIAKW
jgi:hypothetical protein